MISLTHNTEKLRKLILENPDLPMVVIAGADASDGEHSCYCEIVSCDIGEILDCEVPYGEYVETDRDHFEAELYDWVCDYYESITASCEVPDDVFEEEKAKYESYWKKAIVIKVDN